MESCLESVSLTELLSLVKSSSQETSPTLVPKNENRKNAPCKRDSQSNKCTIQGNSFNTSSV